MEFKANYMVFVNWLLKILNFACICASYLNARKLVILIEEKKDARDGNRTNRTMDTISSVSSGNTNQGV